MYDMILGFNACLVDFDYVFAIALISFLGVIWFYSSKLVINYVASMKIISFACNLRMQL